MESLKLRPFQAEALATLAKPGHLVCLAPTGAGKSLIYERLAAVPGRRTLLVSPLVALARQQRERLRSAGVPAVMSGGGEADPRPDRGWSGVWIVSPESLDSERGRARVADWRPELLVVDECHCLWEWGESFRPAFRRLPGLVAELGIARSLWLTATLPLAARRDLLSRLPPGTRVQGGFALPPRLELEIRELAWPDRLPALLEWTDPAKADRGHGVVFAGTRVLAARVAHLLAASGRSAVPYHAGLSAEERRLAEQLVRRQVPSIVVATSAFGMGMDHSHLRWCLLLQAPPNLLAFAQAIGRCGRDPAAPAQARLYWDSGDFRLLDDPDAPERARRELAEVHALVRHHGCLGARLGAYFEPGEYQPCGVCARCRPRPDLPIVNRISRDFPSEIVGGVYPP